MAIVDDGTHALHPNMRAVLKTIRWAEGTSSHPLTKFDGYDVIVTGRDEQGHATPEVFMDFSHHPFCAPTVRKPKLIRAATPGARALYSDAAGAYQLMARWWPPYAKQLRLPDFGIASQVKIALQQIAEVHAVEDIVAGHLQIAVAKMSTRWASLPGPGIPGQPERSYDALVAQYTQAGGTVA